jgi:ubiquinone/menaquinone biosynthesis C-methylase UbiE
MSQPSPQQLPSTWDAVAKTYAENVHHWNGFAQEAARRAPLAADSRVLDVGCGPGTLAFFVAPHVARVDAVDFSPEMIAELRARADRDGVRNIEAAVMSADALRFDDAVFDVAFSLFAFFFFPDRPRAFAELYRVLKPGGHLVIGTWGPIERRPFMKLGFDAVAEALPQFPRPTKGDLQDPETCVREVTEAGFHDVAAFPFTWSIHVASAREYVSMLTRSGAPFAVMRKKMDEAAWDAAIARIVEAVEKRLPAGGADLSAEAIFTIARR